MKRLSMSFAPVEGARHRPIAVGIETSQSPNLVLQNLRSEPDTAPSPWGLKPEGEDVEGLDRFGEPDTAPSPWGLKPGELGPDAAGLLVSPTPPHRRGD